MAGPASLSFRLPRPFQVPAVRVRIAPPEARLPFEPSIDLPGIIVQPVASTDAASAAPSQPTSAASSPPETRAAPPPIEQHGPRIDHYVDPVAKTRWEKATILRCLREKGCSDLRRPTKADFVAAANAAGLKERQTRSIWARRHEPEKRRGRISTFEKETASREDHDHHSEMVAPVRFALKASRKRRRHDESGGKKTIDGTGCGGVFSSIDALQHEETKVGDCRRRRRVELLEDAQAKVKRLKNEGNTLAEAGRFQAAIGRWQEALGVDPDNAVLYELLAQASMAVYEDFQAVQFARRATDVAPTWSEGFSTLARCQLNFGELTLALEALNQALELNDGVETEEMTCDRRDIEELLVKQQQVLHKRDEEAAREVEADKLQVISCFKHLTLRAKTINASGRS